LDSIVNSMTVSWAGGSITHTDSTSVAAYGIRTWNVSTQATTAQQARSVAEWVVERRKDPASKVRGVTCSHRSTKQRNEFAQNLKVGDRVSFNITPGNNGSATARDLWVEGVTHTCQGVVWETSFRFSPADDFMPWVWGTSAWGVDTYWG
jgi:hypothetical protein